MAWKFADGKAIYLQIMEYILMDILSGKYRMGEKIPSVRDLAMEAAVNPNTMQKALSEMESYGLVSAQRTAGRYITTDEAAIERARKSMAKNFAETYRRSMAKLGYTEEEMTRMLSEPQETPAEESDRIRDPEKPENQPTN